MNPCSLRLAEVCPPLSSVLVGNSDENPQVLVGEVFDIDPWGIIAYTIQGTWL